MRASLKRGASPHLAPSCPPKPAVGRRRKWRDSSRAAPGAGNPPRTSSLFPHSLIDSPHPPSPVSGEGSSLARSRPEDRAAALRRQRPHGGVFRRGAVTHAVRHFIFRSSRRDATHFGETPAREIRHLLCCDADPRPIAGKIAEGLCYFFRHRSVHMR